MPSMSPQTDVANAGTMSFTARLVSDLQAVRSALSLQGVHAQLVERCDSALALAVHLEVGVSRTKTVLVQALEAIYAGSVSTGRWVDANGATCEEHHEGAEWEPHGEAEHARWQETVASLAREALTAVEHTIRPIGAITQERKV